MSCGRLLVPESRSRPISHPISLAVVIFEPDKVRHDPVVFLSGGPGQPAAIKTGAEIEAWWQFVSEQDWLRGRRLVVLDQRGVGLSRPSLDCPAFTDPHQKQGIVAPPAGNAAVEEAARRSAVLSCRSSLLDRGIDLSAYNTWESAEDVEDLRSSLGIDKWVLYGVSYGTEVAMTTLERHPAGVSAAILDSVLPPKTSYLSHDGANLARAISLLDADCQKDLRCRSGPLSLGDMVEKTVSRLNATPVPLWFGAKHELPGDMLLDGDDYLEFLFNAFYDSEMLALLPSVIRDTYDQDYRLLASLLPDPNKDSGGDTFVGLDYSVTCTEAATASVDPATPAYMRKWAMGSDYSLACPLWLTAKDPPSPIPLARSDIPVLFLSGKYDPATPARWARSAARDFPAGQSIVFQGVGHDVLDSETCASEVVGDFLKRPEAAVQSSCLADMGPPKFISTDDETGAIQAAASLAGVEEQAMSRRARTIHHEKRPPNSLRPPAPCGAP